VESIDAQSHSRKRPLVHNKKGRRKSYEKDWATKELARGIKTSPENVNRKKEANHRCDQEEPCTMLLVMFPTRFVPASTSTK
jgi:hypothetical protein